MNKYILFIIPIFVFLIQIVFLPYIQFFKKYDKEEDKLITSWSRVLSVTIITTSIFTLLCILSILIYNRIKNSKISASKHNFDKSIDDLDDCEVGVNEYNKYKNSKVGKFMKSYPSKVVDVCGEGPETTEFFRKRKPPKDDIIAHFSNELGKAVKEKKYIIECMKKSQAPASDYFMHSIRNVNDRILGYSALMDNPNTIAADYENTKDIVKRYVRDYIIQRPDYINSSNKNKFIEDYVKELSIKYPNKYNSNLFNELIEMEYNVNLNKLRKNALSCDKNSTLYKRSKELSDDIYKLDNYDNRKFLCRQKDVINEICKDKECSDFYKEYCDKYIKLQSDRLLPNLE